MVEEDAPTPVLTGLNNPANVAVDSTSIYISDPGNNRVIKVPLAGGPTTTLAAGLNNPAGVAVDSTSIYISDSGNNQVIKVPLAGGTTTMLAAGLNNPAGVAVDSNNVYVSDSGHNLLIKVPLAGGATTNLCSTPLNNPTGVAVHGTSVYVSDSGNNQVVTVPVAGGIATMLLAPVNRPAGLAVDSSGNCYIIGNGQVLKLATGTTTPTTLVSGVNMTKVSATITLVSILNPAGVAVDSSGKLYVTA